MPAATRLAGHERRLAMEKTTPFANLRFRNVGPEIQGGRIVDIDGPRNRPETLFVAFATGGLWRTDNKGGSWTPLFDAESANALGAIAVGDAEGVGPLGRHRRSELEPVDLLRDRRLQVDRRREELDEHGSPRLAPDREDPRRLRRSRRRLRRRHRAALHRRRRAGPLPDDGRREELDEGPRRARAHRRHRRRPGPEGPEAPLRRALGEATARPGTSSSRDPAAGSTARRTAGRPGAASPADSRRGTSSGGSASP